ncbi:MAG: hypothetical protein SWI22_03230 [Pseudomonadota bacterium]|nr:hypothetical protein [Pseudomonadota bacterium]
MQDPKSIIESAEIGGVEEGVLESQTPPLNLDKVPDGVVSGSTLIDFTAAPNLTVRSSVSLAMLFASRVATVSMKEGDDEDDWLALYTRKLGEIGFRVSGSAVTRSKFKKTGVAVHKALIPFLTIAFGGGAVGPIILAGLKNLQDMNKDDPWIALFDRQTRRFSVSEMHFAAVSSTETETVIRYVVARLDIASGTTTVLFFRLEKANAEFESVSTTMTADNSLLASLEPQLRAKLERIVSTTIAEADIG